jgi:hypothetical protein
MLGFLVNPEDVGDMFLRNAYWLLGVKSQKRENVLRSSKAEDLPEAQMVSSTESS